MSKIPDNPDDAVVLISKKKGASGIATQINKYLEETVGGDDGDYFVLNEFVMDVKRRDDGEMDKFKVVLVEAFDGVKYQLWFNITDCT